MKKTKEEILKQFQKVRTNAISEMFDNVDKNGIYPTTKFFKVLDNFVLKNCGLVNNKRIPKLIFITPFILILFYIFFTKALFLGIFLEMLGASVIVGFFIYGCASLFKKIQL